MKLTLIKWALCCVAMALLNFLFGKFGLYCAVIATIIVMLD